MDSLPSPWGKKHPYIFSKFNLLNMDTHQYAHFLWPPLVSVLTGFDCIIIMKTLVADLFVLF